VSRSMLLLALLGATSALASLPELYGDGARSTAMGGTGVANANDGSAAFFNPAMLAFAKKPVLTLNFASGSSVADVRSLEVGRDVRRGSLDSPVYSGAGVGAVLPLGGKLQDTVVLGIDFYTPTAGLLRARSPTPDDPYLFMHHNMPNRLIVAASVGVRLAETVTVGLGALVLADLDGSGADVTLDALNRSLSDRSIDSGLYTKTAIIGGFTYAPSDALTIGFSYRGELDNVNHIPANIHVGNLVTLGMDISLRNHWTPHTFTGAVSFRPNPQWELAVDAIYGLWSRAPTPYTSIVVDVSGDLLDSIGLGALLDMEAVSPKPRFKDTLSLRVGSEYQTSENVLVRFGAGWRPTPVPQQNTLEEESSPTNILDGNTVSFSGGLGLRFQDPLDLFPKPLQFDLTAYLSVLLPREAYKGPEDLNPSYRYSGIAAGGMGTLRYDF